MFARTVTMQIKPNTLNDFTAKFEKDVVPMLRRQAGFRDEIVLVAEGDMNVTAISLWDTKELSETYVSNTYPAILKALDQFLDSPPKVRVSNVTNSTLHKLTAASVVAA